MHNRSVPEIDGAFVFQERQAEAAAQTRLNDLDEKLGERMILEISLEIKITRYVHLWIGWRGAGKQPRNNSKSHSGKLRLYFV